METKTTKTKSAAKKTSSKTASKAEAAEDKAAKKVETVEEETVETKEEDVVEAEKPVKKTKVEPLSDSDEIEVVALIPNVDYINVDTLDKFEWSDAGEVVMMTFGEIKSMWKKHKGYFRNMWLKPMDERVIEKLGLSRVYDKYEYLMDSENYDSGNAEEIADAISSVPNDLKISIVRKVTDMVGTGELSDVKIIRVLERKLDIDLISLLD